MTKDIEREAFEEALAGNSIHNLKVCTIFDDEKNEYFASDVCDPSEDHIVESINLSWRMWQAAKAHEAEKLKGKVVVPVEMPDSFDDALYMYSNDISVVNSEGDGFIPMADLDHGKVWQLVLEAARGGNEQLD